MPPHEHTDVVVVGAGFAGIAAAMALQDHRDVRVLEASTRLGGRAWTVRDADGRTIDRGGHFVGVEHTAMMGLIDELGMHDQRVDYVAGFASDPCSVSDMAGRRVVTRVSDTYLQIQGLDASAPIPEQAAMIRVLAELAALTQLVDAAQPALTPGAARLDAITFDDYVAARSLPDWFADLVYSGVRGVWSQAPERMSLLYVLWYMKTNGGFSQVFCDQDGSPQQYGLRCGAGALLERWAQRLITPPELSRRVTGVHITPSGCRVHTDDRPPIDCDHVVLAVTPGQLQHIDFEPALPAPIAALASGPAGFAIKATVFFDTPWWRDGHGDESGVFGWLNGRGRGGIDWMLDMSGPTDHDLKLACFITPELLDPLPRDAWEGAVRRAMVDLTHDSRAGEPVAMDITDWRTVDGVACGPNTNFAPGMLTAAAPWWGRPLFERLHLAATEFSDAYCGYMEGAIRSGRRAAAAALGHHARYAPTPAGRLAQRALRRLRRTP